MTKLITTLLMSTSLLFAACGDEEDDVDLTSTLTIENDSSFAFLAINLSSVDSSSWGEDILGSDILEPGEAVVIGGIECDDYDIRIIDEDSDECVIDDIDLCLTNESWVIDDSTLVDCIEF